ncbi:thiol-disulfide isomerase-like thioredoxin [Spongiibacter sp. IMCC21906]|uniref:TlpA family protein disulfide reductase n=1 Tax=Spongiibacter sp. IMCC21906 TaxID=1620392 RepID=UPI00062DDA83|nr:TlpA disulfide reductase family protein [Spongiibacter sp. IMCC21906]AKH69048.1 thiol-disulfide isomerase-like thioredoxin [Spongiibacter sp. IMCC21906]
MNNKIFSKYRIFFWVLLSAAVLGGCGKSDFDVHGGDAAEFKQGKWLLLNYWATWCGPCREEIPDLNEFDKARDDVVVYGINYDGLVDEPLNSAITEMGIEFQSMLQDPAPLLGVDRPRVLPSTFLISPKGKLVEILTGPQTTSSLNTAIATAQAKQ